MGSRWNCVRTLFSQCSPFILSIVIIGRSYGTPKNMKLIRWLVPIFAALALLSVFSSNGAKAKEKVSTVPPYKSCLEDPPRQKLRSKELQTLATEDQADREGPNIDWDIVAPRDEKRAQRVGAIFGEGCFLTGPDYSAAALIFQHGPHIDHNFQSYLWAKKALELGDSSRKELIVDGIDRFLVRQGYKQLFGGITHRTGPQRCRCLDDVEERFSESKRVEMGGKLLTVSLKEVTDFNSTIEGCSHIRFCGGLKSPPHGIVPGIW